MVTARELYALLKTFAFRLLVNPDDTASYMRPTIVGEIVNTTPLTHTEQALINTLFMHQKNYFMSMQNIERACYTALDTSIQGVKHPHWTGLACRHARTGHRLPVEQHLQQAHVCHP
jgi:hypothetical protein